MHMGVRICTTLVMVVRSDGSVGLRLGERTRTPGLFVVADCPACAWPGDTGEHVHRRWRLQTTFGYLVGELSLTSRREAMAAASALGALSLDWTDARLALDHDEEARTTVATLLSRWGAGPCRAVTQCARVVTKSDLRWGKMGAARPRTR
jgi:hypothetical protein